MVNRIIPLLAQLISSAILINAPAFSTDSVLNLNDIMEGHRELRSTLKSLIYTSPLTDKTQTLKCIEAEEEFFKEKATRQKNQKILDTIFSGHMWSPKAHQFKDRSLQNLFEPYAPNPNISPKEIFLTNMFYESKERGSNLEMAAVLGHSHAQYEMFFEAYKGGNKTSACNYIFCSAAQGYPKALYTLSTIFEGYWRLDIPKNLNIAKALCLEAANNGNEEAQFSLQVAPYTEGTYNMPRNYQLGVRNAKALADQGNKRAQEFIEGMMSSSGEALTEANEDITEDDLDFLRIFLGWKDEWDSFEEKITD